VIGVLVDRPAPDPEALGLAHELAVTADRGLALLFTARPSAFPGLLLESGIDPRLMAHEGEMARRRSARDAIERIDPGFRYVVYTSAWRPFLFGAVAQAVQARCGTLVLSHRALAFVTSPARMLASRAGVELVEAPRA
jgi:hypothetical protein